MPSLFYGDQGYEGPFRDQPEDGCHYITGFHPYGRDAYKYIWHVNGVEYFAGKVMEHEGSYWHIRWFLGCWDKDGEIRVVEPKIGGIKDGKRRTGYNFYEKRTPRDSQRQKVYDAEQYAIRSSDTNRDRSEAEIRLWVQRTIDENWFRSNFPEVTHVNIEVSNARFRTSTAWRDRRLIALAAGWGQRDDVVIHELAHIVHEDDPRDTATRKRQSSTIGKKQAGHGPEYCAHYIYLLEMMGHPEWANALLLEFQVRGVKTCAKTLATLRRRGEERLDLQYAATRG